jgi:hypothetical protein
MPYCYRNIDGDLLYFVHRDNGVFATEFGPLRYEPGDYVLLLKRDQLMPEDADGLLLVVETPQPIRLYEHEQVGRHTPIDPTVLQVPDVADYGGPTQDEWELRIKHAGAHTSIFYRNNPMDVVGWKGDLFPFKLNVRDIRPIISDRIHLPPSAFGVILAHADDDPKGRRSGGFSFTPQGVLHGADEALPRRISDPAHTGDAADAHRHRRRHLSAAERIARVRANDGVIPRPFPERGRPAPTSPPTAGTRHSRTLGRVPQLSFAATAPVQRRAFRARLGQLGLSSPALARRKRLGNA